MTIAGNRTWAYAEAKRRARVMDRAYSIYQNGSDYIVRIAEAECPRNWWQRVATIQANGFFSLGSDILGDSFASTRPLNETEY